MASRQGKQLAAGRARDRFRMAGRIWVEMDGEIFLGWGRITLLERIRETGSISKAARSMGMGYRHAWALVDEMNRRSPVPLVAKATGGAGGGGSRVTEEGERAIEGFRSLVEDFRGWLGGKSPKIWKGGGR
jgi:molybdate transport system regulatory protein